ncbi:ROK family transcriptional regulator [Anaerolentibacter hominis]|uniref:ROK family transcriptional regulator n=1 Tax=Anaerolentibacter hominis TaxID=3079009 RepID=UPI0031B8207B
MNARIGHGVNQSDIQKMNMALVINSLRKHQADTRIDLSRITGLTQTTISNLVNVLLEQGLVYEYPKESGRVGRRSIGLSLNMERYHIIQVRITNSGFSAGRYNMENKLYESYSEDIDPALPPMDTMARMLDAIGRLIKIADHPPVLGIGISLPGPYNSSGEYLGVITELPGWEAIRIRTIIYEAFHLPTYAQNDANIGALSEWWMDPEIQDGQTLVYVTTSKGIGAGVVSDGRLLNGSQGLAGEIGHTTVCIDGEPCKCGNRGCLELYASTDALLKQVHSQAGEYRATSLTPDSTLKEFFQQLKMGDPLACTVFDSTIRYLAVGVVNIIYTYNPDFIIFGDEMVTFGGGERLLGIVKKYVSEHVHPEIYDHLTIRLSTSKTDPSLLGAGILVMNDISNILFS